MRAILTGTVGYIMSTTLWDTSFSTVFILGVSKNVILVKCKFDDCVHPT